MVSITGWRSLCVKRAPRRGVSSPSRRDGAPQRGMNSPAKGNVLGLGHPDPCSALKGRNTCVTQGRIAWVSWSRRYALSGLNPCFMGVLPGRCPLLMSVGPLGRVGDDAFCGQTLLLWQAQVLPWAGHGHIFGTAAQRLSAKFPKCLSFLVFLFSLPPASIRPI